VVPASIRHGKLATSQRYANAAAKSKAMKTNLRLGIDPIEYETTARLSASTGAANVPAEVHALRQPRIDKFASDKDSICGTSAAHFSDPEKVYKSTHFSDFHPGTTALSKDFAKGKPAFDRLNANKTNYQLSLSSTHHDLRATSHAHHVDPQSLPVRPGFEQAVIGGWAKSSGDYCVDETSRGSVMRGGGGGEGSLGVRFDIITNKKDPEARKKTLMRTGPRISCNVRDPWRMGAGPHGDIPEGKVNILSGKAGKVPMAPARLKPQDLVRADEPVLRTRPW